MVGKVSHSNSALPDSRFDQIFTVTSNPLSPPLALLSKLFSQKRSNPSLLEPRLMVPPQLLQVHTLPLPRQQRARRRPLLLLPRQLHLLVLLAPVQPNSNTLAVRTHPASHPKTKSIIVNESSAEFGNQNIPGTLNKDYTWPSPSSVDYFLG
jgi:hypothetical protein